MLQVHYLPASLGFMVDKNGDDLTFDGDPISNIATQLSINYYPRLITHSVIHRINPW